MKDDDGNDDTQTVRMWPWRTEKKAGHKSIRVGPAQPHKARLQANEDDNGSDNTMRRILPQLIALSPPCRSLSLSLSPSVCPSAQLFFHQSSRSTATAFCSPLSFTCHKYCTNHRERAAGPASLEVIPAVCFSPYVGYLARSLGSLDGLPSFSPLSTRGE